MNLTSQVKDCIVNMLNHNYKDEDYLSQNYKLISKEPIGAGGFGKVFKVVAIQPDKNSPILALKTIKIGYEQNYSDESVSIMTSGSDQKNILEFVQCCQEAVLQSEVFDHPNIVKVHDKWIQKPSTSKANHLSSTNYAAKILTIMEFLKSAGQDAGVNVVELTPDVREALISTEGLCFYLAMDLYDSSLKSWISMKREPQVKMDIIVQILEALVYIHGKKTYCHLDLSLSNIFVKHDENGISAAIGDFGLSLFYDPSVLQRIEDRPGKPPYNLAPDEYFTDLFDMWSFGFIAYEVLCADPPTNMELNELYRVAINDSPDLYVYVPCQLDPYIVEQCLQLNDQMRSHAIELLHYLRPKPTVLHDFSSSDPSEDDRMSSTSILSIVSSCSSLNQFGSSYSFGKALPIADPTRHSTSLSSAVSNDSFPSLDFYPSEDEIVFSPPNASESMMHEETSPHYLSQIDLPPWIPDVPELQEVDSDFYQNLPTTP